MGTFAQLQYTDGAWTEHVGIEAEPLARDPDALRIDIHDSDIAGLTWPTEQGLGLLFLGHQPRYYLDEDASPQLDVAQEAAALAAWARSTTGADVDQAAVERLAAPNDPGHEPEDVFVEETVTRLLLLLGLPLPEVLVT